MALRAGKVLGSRSHISFTSHSSLQAFLAPAVLLFWGDVVPSLRNTDDVAHCLADNNKILSGAKQHLPHSEISMRCAIYV